MGRFSAESIRRLARATPGLQGLFEEVVQSFDCTVLETDRTPEQQAANVAKGVSKTLESLHLVDEANPLARAADVAPFPLTWPKRPTFLETISPGLRAEVSAYVKDMARWYYFGGYVQGVAKKRGLSIRWGGDWDGDRDIKDQNFDDLPHFEERSTG